MPKPPPEIDELLSEDDWIRRLARRLVPDPALADDLVQDTWVTALEHSGQARALRPWLGGVLRNLVRTNRRSSGRREQRERAAARREALPSAADLVEEVTLRREVADQLLELEEPYRSILYLRFFRDYSLKKIARESGVPLSTVHERVQRGLEKMRRRLDRAHGGDRRAWALAMLPLAQPTGGLVATTAAGLAMSTTFKIVASVAVAGGALGLWIQNRESQALEAPAVVQRPAETVARNDELPERLVEPPEAAGERTAFVAPVASAAPLAESESSRATVFVEGIVIDTARRPVAGVKVGYLEDRSNEILVAVRTDAGGRFTIERPAVEMDAWDAADPLVRKLGRGSFTVDDIHYATLSTGVDGNDDLVLVVEPKADFAGRVIDEAGEPVEGAKVAVRVRRSLHRELGFSQFFSNDVAGEEVMTDVVGEFLIADSCGGDAVYLDVVQEGFEPVELELPREGDLELLVTLTRIDDTIDVTGRVVDRGGAPVAGAQVSMGHTVERTNARGEFTLHWSLSEARKATYMVQREDGVWVPEELPLQIVALAEGHMPARLDLEGADLTEPLLLRLGEGPLSILGTVVDAEGRPRAGAVVWARNLTRFGKQILRQGQNMSSYQLTVEEQLRGSGQSRGVACDEQGHFELSGLLDQDYDLVLYDPATAELAPGGTIAAGRQDVELVFARDASLAPVAGRLVSTGGAPIAGVTVTAHRSLEPSRTRYDNPPEPLLQQVTTDADGHFAFALLATERTTLQLFGPDIFFRSVTLGEHADLDDLEIVEPLLCELQVELDDPELASLLTVEDGRGEQLEVIESFGVFVSQGSTASFEDGRSGVLRVPETARTLVLHLAGEEGRVEVARRPLALVPGERTVVRP